MMQTQNFAQLRGVDPEVKKQYDSIKSDQGTQVRRDSPINNLRNYSNWVKWVLIDNYCWTGANVLDIGCSRGTDLDKFAKAGISSYVGVDISKPALEAGVRKFNSSEGFKFDCKFVHADFCKSRFARSILSNYADVVSSQVTLQYAFANLENARTFLHNVSDMLRPGGYFIGSVPDADILVQKLEQSNNNVFGNSKYTIKFDGNKSQVIQCYKQGRQDCYGVRYLATLQGAINDCPEFLVPFITLERLANEFDLELEMHTNFRDVFDLYSRVPQYKEKLDSWGLYPPSRGGQSHLTDEDWDLIGLYSVFAFRKKVTAGVATKRQLTDQDIVILQTEQHTQQQQQQQGQTAQTSRT